mgnify:CR=1 FL=1
MTPPLAQAGLFEENEPIKEVRLAPLGEDRQGVAFVANSGAILEPDNDYGIRYAYGRIVPMGRAGQLQIEELEVVEQAKTKDWALAHQGPNGHVAAWVEVKVGADEQVQHQKARFALWSQSGLRSYPVYKVLNDDEINDPSFGANDGDVNQFKLVWSTYNGERVGDVHMVDGQFCQ